MQIFEQTKTKNIDSTSMKTFSITIRKKKEIPTIDECVDFTCSSLIIVLKKINTQQNICLSRRYLNVPRQTRGKRMYVWWCVWGGGEG